MNNNTSGVLAIVGACTIWGLSPLFYKIVAHVPAFEVLAHRTLWSTVFFGCLLGLQGRLGEVWAALGHRRSAALLIFASLMISINWYLFIWAVGNGRTTESSLGYYIFPLVAVLLGRLVLKEALARQQWMAVGLAALAVALLTWGLGAAPWIALVLAFSFGLYSLVKKQLDIGPVVSVTAEVALLVPIAIAVLLQSWHNGTSAMGQNWTTDTTLVLSGIMTALPLILFSYGARRAQLATVGLVQFLNPTLQFGCAVFVFSETFTGWHMIAFAMIWAALALYTASARAQDKEGRKAATADAASGTSVT